jgi:glycerol-3-phosphate acyltransferase PlsY
MIIAKFILVIALGYLIGSIPFGVLIGRRFAKIDVRNYGSGKMGTTNVLRTVGKKAALLVAAADLLKGIIPVILAGLILKTDFMIVGNIGLGTIFGQVGAALAAIIGHTFPIFLRFRGGRGVATFFGGLIALCPIAGIFGAEILVISVGFTRFVSFGSIVGAIGTYAVLIPLTLFNGFPLIVLLYSLIGAVIILVMHRDNIMRLLRGKERKLGEKSNPENPAATI